MEDKPTVLVVDDEAFNVDYLLQELEEYGVNTISANNGIEALEQVNQHSPDLVLLDIMMPKMDGFGVLAKMKSESATRDIPVIVISANSEMQQVLKGIEMGAEDYLPKPFNPQLLKARVNASLEKKRLHNLEKEYLKGLERELEIGQRIQAGFLPKDIVSPDGWEIVAFFRAAKEVSGDFYDVFSLPNGQLALMVGDVTDKGVGAALYMALYRSLLRAFLSTNGFTGGEAAGILSRAVKFVNDYICKVHNSELYATVFIALLDEKSGTLSYVSAGHDAPIMIMTDGTLQEIKPTGPAVGILEDSEFAVEEIKMSAGETLVIFTDGLLDSRNGNGEALGREKLRKLVRANAADLKTTIGNMVTELDKFSADVAQYDDLTLLGIKRAN